MKFELQVASEIFAEPAREPTVAEKTCNLVLVLVAHQLQQTARGSERERQCRVAAGQRSFARTDRAYTLFEALCPRGVLVRGQVADATFDQRVERFARWLLKRPGNRIAAH